MNLYIDCTGGVSGDMLCRGLSALCPDRDFVEEQQQLASDELHHQDLHDHGHVHGDDAGHGDVAGHDHGHPHAYTHRSFQSLLDLLAGCGLDDDVKALTLKTYTVLAIAEAKVHGATLETVHFHEVGRPQAIINMVGIAAALTAIGPEKVYCSKIMDGIGTVLCAHGEISVPVPAVRAMMDSSHLHFGTAQVPMEMVTPTGLAALLAMEPAYLAARPDPQRIQNTSETRGDRQMQGGDTRPGLHIMTFI